MPESIDLKQRLAELRRDRIFENVVWTAMGLIFAVVLVTAYRGDGHFVFLKVTSALVAVWFSGSEIVNRRRCTFESWRTRELILILPNLDLGDRKGLVNELCNRAIARDQMAKAFLYGRSWQERSDRPRRPVLRERRSLIWPRYRAERIKVYDPFRGFRTVKVSSRRAQVSVIYAVTAVALAGAILKDYSHDLRKINDDLSRWLSMAGWLGMHSWYVLAWRSWRNDDKGLALLSGLSTRQVIFVFVHRRWGLREIAGFQLRSRSDEPEARAACLRLGLVMEGAVDNADALKRFRTITEARVPEEVH